jgi:Zn-dependent peptidase ImmA (M78 family)/DNA-binding XRE family transcriptional regulator
MRRSVKVKVSPSLLKKLRESSGYTVEELAKKLGVSIKKIKDVEEGKDNFTLSQLKNLANVYKIPLVAFFLEEIPEIPSLPDYRINREKKLNPEVFIAIRRAKYLSEVIKELSGKSSKIPKFPKELSPEELAKKFREYLGVGIPEFENSLEALEFYKDKLEKKLVILIIEYPLKSDDVRAFSLRSDLSVIVLNESDEPQVKLFSLFHEVGHLLISSEGICSIDVEVKQSGIEEFCNRFAAEFLAPSEILEKEIKSKKFSDKRISKLARRYGVSTQVMMIRLLNLGYITKEQYLKFKEKFDKEKLKERKRIKDWERTFLNRVGRLAISEVSKAYRRGDISFFEAVRILDMKPKYVEKFMG